MPRLFSQRDQERQRLSLHRRLLGKLQDDTAIQTPPSARKAHRLTRFFKRARNLFRDSSPVEPSPPSGPLNIPALPEHVGDLLGEIDGELSLIRDRTVADCSSSTPMSHPLEPETFGVTTDSTGQTSVEEKSARPITSSSDSLACTILQEASSIVHTSDLPGQYTASSSNSSSLARHQLHTPGAIKDGIVQSSDDSSLSSSFDEPVGAPESSVLDIVRHTWKNARDRLHSSAEMKQKAAQSHVRAIDARSSPSSWVYRVVDRDLREDLLAARTAFEEQYLPESSLFRSADQHCTRITPSHATELSRDLANRHFFESPSADAPANLNLPTLFCESEYVAASEAGQSNTAVSVSEPLISGMEATKTPCFSQPLSEVEKGRKARLFFAQRLEEALVEQEANLTSKFVTEMAQQRLEFEAAEQERYDSTASLHDIELRNLRDDHEAETKGLERTTKDLRTRLADRGKAVRKLRREMRLLSSQSRDSENQLQEKCGQFDQLLQAFQERETMLQQQTKDFHDLREELDRTKRGCERSMCDRQYENGKLHRSHTQLKERYNGLLTGLNQSNLDRQKGEAQLNTTRAQLEATQAALGERERANEMLRARHDHMVAEKVKDYSWHVAHRVNPLAMKPMNTEDEIAEATKQLHETLEQQIELSADLRQKLESAQASNKAKFKKLKRVIANQSQEKVILEMALTMAQVQRDDWAKQYDEIAEAVASKLNFSSHARGIAERQILLQRTRHTLECELLEARLRGDRAVLECAIRQRHETIKLEKRDAEIAKLKRKLGIMKQKFEYENGMALLYREVIDKEVPGLRARNSEVERLLEDQITNNVNAHHQAVFKDLHSRIRELETANQYWENEIYTYLQDNSSLKTEYNLFSCCVFSDLSNAHGWRDDRDRLELENVAFRERFADELMNEPLVIPEDKKTSKQIEEEFKLESIDELLLRQFAFSWEAVPRQIMAKDAPPWEHIRADMKEDMDARKKRWIAERDAVHESFKKDCAEVPNDHEWIDDADEFEAMWKGKAKLVGEGIGFDGRMAGAGSSAQEDPTVVFF